MNANIFSFLELEEIRRLKGMYSNFEACSFCSVEERLCNVPNNRYL